MGKSTKKEQGITGQRIIKHPKGKALANKKLMWRRGNPKHINICKILIQKMKNKIIILGSSGFIGNQLLKQFSKDGKFKVIGYSSRNCNLLSMQSVLDKLSIVKQEDIIIMTSAITRSNENSFAAMLQNITMAENVSQFIKKNKVKYFIFLSTIEVYGIQKNNKEINEKTMSNPNNYYSISKISSEFLIRTCCKINNIPLLILRLPGVYGSGDKDKSTIYNIVNSAISKEKITILGDGEVKRDYIYVEDIYKLIKNAIRNRTDLILNLATGRSFRIVDIAKKIKSNLSKDIKIEFKHDDIVKNSGVKITKELNFDISLLNKIFPELKLTRLEDGLKNYILDFNKKGGL